MSLKESSQLAFYNDITRLFDKDELESFLLDQNKFYRAYAEEYWLLQYHDLKRESRKAHVPPITAVLSQTPSSKTNEFNSTVENAVLESIEAGEKLELLHEAVDSLVYEHQQLIKLKYFQMRSDGNLYEDSYVYDTLGLSRTQYYRVKRLALEILGDNLYEIHLDYLSS